MKRAFGVAVSIIVVVAFGVWVWFVPKWDGDTIAIAVVYAAMSIWVIKTFLTI